MDGKAGLKLISTRTDKEVEDYKTDHKPCRMDCGECRKTFFTIAQWKKHADKCKKCDNGAYKKKNDSTRIKPHPR